MRIAIVGSAGQLGAELCHQLAEDDVIPLARRDADVTDAKAVASALSDCQPEFVINTAAYNKVDQAEDEPELAFAVNALGPRNLARWCRDHDVPLLHFSSDYVFGFDRTRRSPYREEDLPGPQTAYGVSKLAGEYYVQSGCTKHFVVRTCGLYGFRATADKGNFVETMLRLGRERDELRVVQDQLCTPTYTADLAGGIDALIRTDAYGLYHATNSGATSWFDFACEIFQIAEMEVTVRPVTTEEYGAKAQRPCYSVLSTKKFTLATGYHFPHWRDALGRYLQERPSD